MHTFETSQRHTILFHFYLFLQACKCVRVLFFMERNKKKATGGYASDKIVAGLYVDVTDLGIEII